MTSSAPTRRPRATRAQPLLVLEPLLEFLRANGLDAPDDLTAVPIGDGHSNVTFALSTGVVLRRPPRGPLPPSAHDVLREARLLRRSSPRRCGRPRCSPCAMTQSVIGAPFYVMEQVEGERDHRLDARAARQPRAARPDRRRADRRARRAARGRLDGDRPRGLRQADAATSSASCGDSPGCGSTTGRASSPRSKQVGELAAGKHARLAAGDDRPRRLPPRQHDVRLPQPGAAGRDPRLGDGDDRRPARRCRLHDDPLDPARRRAGPLQPAQRHHAARLSQAARR